MSFLTGIHVKCQIQLSLVYVMQLSLVYVMSLENFTLEMHHFMFPISYYTWCGYTLVT